MFSLLDPSCSGSGIVNRLDYLLAGTPRMANKADRQNKKLKMRRMPKQRDWRNSLLSNYK